MAKRTSERHMHIVDGARIGDAAHLLCSLKEVLELVYGLRVPNQSARVLRASLHSLVGQFTLTTVYYSTGPEGARATLPMYLTLSGVRLSIEGTPKTRIDLFIVDMRGPNPGVTITNIDPVDTNASRALKQGKLF